MPDLHVLRVFAGPDGSGGNPLGVVLDGAAVPAARRQEVAADLGFSETVFVDHAERGTIRIFTPAAELPFAGHPTVGTSWLLARERMPVEVLRPPAGDVPTWAEGALTWIGARPEWAHPLERHKLASAGQVESAAPAGRDLELWAFEDEEAGLVRARVFFPSLGITEDEATGAAAVQLGAELGRPILIRQGMGSLLHARPGPGGTVEVGGRVVLDEVRAL